MKILLVDDDRDDRERAARELRSSDYSVDCAENAELGRHYVRENEYEAAIVDIYLSPGDMRQDGLDLVKSFRKDMNRNFPIMVMTRERDPLAKLQAFRNGATQYFVKADGRKAPGLLIQALDNMIRSHNGWSTGEGSPIVRGTIHMYSDRVEVDGKIIDLGSGLITRK